MVPLRSHLAERRTAGVNRRNGDGPALGLLPFRRFAVSPIPRCALMAVLLLGGVRSGFGAQDPQAVFERWFAAQTNVQTWSADLVQTRSLKILSQPLVSAGKVWVLAPDRFRWELGQPAQTIALRNRDQLLVIYPRLKRAEKYSLGGQLGPWKDALALMEASFPRDRAALDGPFRLLSATETNSILQMALQPKSAAARKFMSEIVVSFHTNDFSLAATELRFSDGSSLRNDFSNGVINQPLAPELFEGKLAPDFTVVEPLRQ